MLEATAEQAPLIGQVRSFLTWAGPGRELTATGRIGLADARHLVELLGTGDTIDPEIGSRVFKTQSSEELAYLSRIVGWAKAARLVRVTGTKLAPVKKNAALADKPLDLVVALLEAYPRLGRPLFPRNTWRASLVGDEFTDQVIYDLLRWHAREEKGRKAGPSLVVLDTQSVHAAASVPAETTGKDPGKKVPGRKRCLAGAA